MAHERSVATTAKTSRAWHALPATTALAILGSDADGLPATEVETRIAAHGPNILRPVAGPGIATLIARQLKSPIIYLLLASAALAFALGKVLDATVVLAAVVINVVIGFLQEHRATKAIEALSKIVRYDALVVRDGRQLTVPAAQLVPGDIVLLSSGDHVPADLRLLATRNLRVDEAALTGESVPVDKAVPVVDEQAALGDRTCMAYGGTLVTAGSARALVVATGDATELGRIAHLIEQATELQTPLTRAIANVGGWLTLAVLAVSGVLFAIGLVRGHTVTDGAFAALTLAVASIPEGLPAIITIALAIGVQRMAARRAVIRRLPTVETLGSTTVICTDKTGTLTRNEMTVRALVAPSGRYELSGVGYAPVGELAAGGHRVATVPADVDALVTAAALCSDAAVHAGDGTWRLAGDPTEGALVVAAMKLGIDVDALRRSWPRRDVIPFESEHQFMATLHTSPRGEHVIFMKGAPEVVLGRTREPAAADHLAALTGDGMRVLAIARKRLVTAPAALSATDVDTGFELLGLEGMIDPPRAEAITAVATCQAAGITVKMITGDHIGTAEAIGRQLGLLAAEDSGVTGAQLARLDDAALRDVALATNVFARVAPEHKLRLVKGLQDCGHVVAMTGDGVNDAPALEQANVGVAMGVAGTAVSKEAADVVLADDNFATIAAAVEEGRRIYDNLVKSLAFVLPTNLGLGFILITAVAAFPLAVMPMSPTQMLWINLVTSVALSLPLAFEVLEPDAMRRPPRAPGAPIFGRFVIVRTLLVAILMCAGAVAMFLWEYAAEVDRTGPEIALREAQTMTVTTVVFFQMLYLFNCRSLRASMRTLGVWSNPTVFIGIASLALLQSAFIYVPFMQDIFGTAALAPEAIVRSMLIAVIILPAIAIEKALWARLERRTAVPALLAPGKAPS